MNYYCPNCNTLKELDEVKIRLIDIYDDQKGVQRLNVEVIKCNQCNTNVDNFDQD